MGVARSWQAGAVPPKTRRPATAGLSWQDAPLAPIVLVRGAEGVLSDRAVAHIVAQARAGDAGTEVSRLDAAGYETGQLQMLASPSLFGEARCLVFNAVESCTDALIDDVIAYLASPADDVWLVLQHGGGVRGKRLLDAVTKAGHPVVACEPIKRDADKAAFVQAEFKRAGRTVDIEAVQALVQAVGSDLRELAAACDQLIADTTGQITGEVVERYHGGRVEATGFKVADAAIAGNAARAISLLRHAVETGANPVVLVAALAVKLRTMAKVEAMSGRGGAGGLGLAPWQVDQARRDLAGWGPEGLARAITAVAAADAEVKGLSRDAVFAVERAVLRIVAARGRR